MGFLRFNLQYLPIDLFRGLQPAGLVVPDCNGVCFRDRGHARRYFQSSVRKGEAGRPALLTRLQGGLFAQA